MWNNRKDHDPRLYPILKFDPSLVDELLYKTIQLVGNYT